MTAAVLQRSRQIELHFRDPISLPAPKSSIPRPQGVIAFCDRPKAARKNPFNPRFISADACDDRIGDRALADPGEVLRQSINLIIVLAEREP
jgi:hypothetical protein